MRPFSETVQSVQTPVVDTSRGRYRAERVVVCTNCGAQNTLGAKFCQECGQSLQPKTQVAPLAAVCKSCGAKLASQAKFCPECGSAV